MADSEKGINSKDGVSPSQPHDCCKAPANFIPAAGKAGKGTRYGTLVAIGAAIMASACCWLPLLLLAIGASAAGAAANVIVALRYPLLAVAAIALGVGFYRTYFRRARCAPGDACATRPQRGTISSRVSLWISTVLVLLFAGLPYYGSGLLHAVTGSGDGNGASPSHAATAFPSGNPPVKSNLGAVVSFPRLSKYEYRVKGMDCSLCAAGLQAMVAKLPGVKSARVSYRDGTAVIVVDPHIFKPTAITQKLVAVGYPTHILDKGGVAIFSGSGRHVRAWLCK